MTEVVQRLYTAVGEAPRRYDVVLLSTTLLLVGLGIVMVFSATGIPAHERLGDSLYFVKRQMVWAGIGLIMLLITAHLPYPALARLAPFVLLVTGVMLVLTHIPGVGITRGGATRWLAFGPIGFQPAEAAKLVIIFYLARYYSRHRTDTSFIATLGRPMLVCAPLILLILAQPDFGTAAVLCTLFLIMAFAAGTPIRHLAAIVLVAAPVAIFVMTSAEYRMRRLVAFVDPWRDMGDAGFQIIQSFLAFSGGGAVGRGLGDGLQKLYFLPAAQDDFVLALVAEELGLVGVGAVIIAFAVLVARGFGLAARHGDSLGRLLAVGLTSAIGLQALINGMVVMGLLPTKGLTLPFVSHGGSSLVMSMTTMGILMGVAAHSSADGGEA